jgi:hypothetical protein
VKKIRGGACASAEPAINSKPASKRIGDLGALGTILIPFDLNR